MSTNQILNKIETLLYWEKIMEEAKAEADALRDEIKQEMMIRNTDELTVGQYIIRWTSVLSQRFDATSFKKVMPDISITSDIIVGFPGETYEEFLDTVSLVEEAKFTSMYTFIFSSRNGTKAASMPDPVSREEKGKWFKELLDAQEKIAAERTASMVGKTYRVLCESVSKGGLIEGRTQGNIIIEFPADESVIGSFREVKVIESLTWILRGELVNTDE